MHARRLIALTIAIAAIAICGYLSWRSCDQIYRAGEVHGRYLAEEQLAPALFDCRGNLNDQQEMGLACDKALLDCTSAARFTAAHDGRGPF